MAVVTGAESPVPSASLASVPDVLLTRRKWTWYFAPATAAAAALGAVAAAASGEARFLVAPVCVLALWWLVRRSTPREGTRHRRLSADPEFLWLLGALVPTVAGIVLATEYAGPQGQVISAGLAGAYLVTMFVLMRRVDRRLKRGRGAAAEPRGAPDRGGGE